MGLHGIAPQGDCFSGNLSVVIQSDDRLTFAACWGHARRKVVEATTYRKEGELLLGMIQALYDIETRGKDLSWQDRQALRERESALVLESMRRWLDTLPLEAGGDGPQGVALRLQRGRGRTERPDDDAGEQRAAA